MKPFLFQVILAVHLGPLAPDIPLRDVIWGVMPFVALMIFAVVVLCIFPGIATWLADAVMGR